MARGRGGAIVSSTNYLAAEILDHLFTDGAYAPPATLYLGLSTTTPTEGGGNFTEPTDGLWARAAPGGRVGGCRPCSSGGPGPPLRVGHKGREDRAVPARAGQPLGGAR